MTFYSSSSSSSRSSSSSTTTTTTTKMDISKAPTLWFKALNKQSASRQTQWNQFTKQLTHNVHINTGSSITMYKIRTHTHTHACTHTCTHTYTRTHTCVHVHACTHTLDRPTCTHTPNTMPNFFNVFIMEKIKIKRAICTSYKWAIVISATPVYLEHWAIYGDCYLLESNCVFNN